MHGMLAARRQLAIVLRNCVSGSQVNVLLGAARLCSAAMQTLVGGGSGFGVCACCRCDSLGLS
jgi:hypothetical protein